MLHLLEINKNNIYIYHKCFELLTTEMLAKTNFYLMKTTDSGYSYAVYWDREYSKSSTARNTPCLCPLECVICGRWVRVDFRVACRSIQSNSNSVTVTSKSYSVANWLPIRPLRSGAVRRAAGYAEASSTECVWVPRVSRYAVETHAQRGPSGTFTFTGAVDAVS